MQKRADVVNKIIYTTASLRAGDAVKIYDQAGEFMGTGTIIQPLFLKRQGIITYRVRRDEGEVFTNEEFRLERLD